MEKRRFQEQERMMDSIERARQWYLDISNRYLKGDLSFVALQVRLPARWAEERETLWPLAWHLTRAQRRREQSHGCRYVRASPSDPRRHMRMIDRLCNLCLQSGSEDLFRESVMRLLAAYRAPSVSDKEAANIDLPPYIAVFERPLPAGSFQRYPCTVADIRARLAQVPEYDLEGLWAVGLAPLYPHSHAYGAYFHGGYPVQRSVILLSSYDRTLDLKIGPHADPGTVERHYSVACQYGMEIVQEGGQGWCRWSPENARRYIVDHVLLHEIGHHVQYRQRWRARLRRRLPTNIKEQFAEDYAIRFSRRRSF